MDKSQIRALGGAQPERVSFAALGDLSTYKR